MCVCSANFAHNLLQASTCTPDTACKGLGEVGKEVRTEDLVVAHVLLASTGALIVMMGYYISVAAASAVGCSKMHKSQKILGGDWQSM